MAQVKIYTTPTCPYCMMAKRLLTKKGVAYEEIGVAGDHEKRAWLREITGRHTVPQVFVDDVAYGGYTDIAALDREGRLDGILAGA